ncbi:MAG: hypothetical protein J6J53_00290 [Muribaculaceae bacterium]|nr:hypothetical protein [Muribaculaceae bacterium]
MSKFTTTLKGLMALALGSFSLSAGAFEPTILSDATVITAAPGQDDNKAVYVLQSKGRGGLYYDTQAGMLTSCGNPDGVKGLSTHGDIAISNSDANQQFAIITYGGNKYFYTLGGAGLISQSNQHGVLNTTNADNAVMTIEAKPNSNGNTYFKITIGGYILNHTDYHDATQYKGIIFAGSASDDDGNLYLIQKLDNVTLSDEQYNAAITVIKGAVETAKAEQIARLNAIKLFYHNPDEIDSYIAQINAASTESQANEIVNTVFDKMDGKMVYLMYAPRENESDYKYLGVLGEGNYRIAQLLPQRGNRAKWRLNRDSEDIYSFRLTNTASNTYITTDVNNGQTQATGKYYKVDFKANSSIEGAVSLKFVSTNICLGIGENVIGGTTRPYTLKWSADNKEAVNAEVNAWKIEPVGMSQSQFDAIDEEGTYVVIRSNRGMTGSPYGGYSGGFGGDLLGVYTADRVIARTNQNLPAGVHLRQFSTGMHTIWKLVKQSDGGFKIYSLIGEQTDGNNHGMHYSGNEIVTTTAEPTTVYIRPVEQWNPVNKPSWPFGMVICSQQNEASAGNYNCFDVSNSLNDAANTINNHDFYVKSNGYSPSHNNGAARDNGTVFYFERVSDYDVEEARKAYVDYAAGTRSFELLKNVLTDDDIKYALSGKTTDPKSVETVAQANAYLNETGEDGKVSSTLAFERLDGKVVRFDNRMYPGYYMSANGEQTDILCFNNNIDTDLSKLWRVEVVNAGLRQVKFVNYSNGKYIGTLPAKDSGGNNGYNPFRLVDSADNAGIYTISRYYSLDGKSFYASLVTNANEKDHNAMHCNGSKQVVRWGQAAVASHWTMMNAVADDVKNTEVTLNYDKENKVIVVSGPALEKTANFPAAYGVTLTPAAATAALDGEAATPVEVAVPNDKITKDGETFKVDLSELNVTPSNYTLNFPVGYFTINNKLAPALSTAVTVSEPTGIKEVNAAEKGAEVIYDLQGRRVSKAGKGVYIINGEKTLVK